MPMSLASRSAPAATLAAVLALTLAGGTAQAAIVVAASGPSAAQFPAGRKLGDAEQVTLRAGDSVTVLDAKGTRVLRGPGAVTVGAPAARSQAGTFAVLTRPRGSARVRTGAVRDPGKDGKVLSPNLWYVDATAGGTHCLVDTSAVRLWRPDREKAAQWRITGAATGAATGRVSFAAGEMVAAWPGAVADGAQFTLAPEGSAASVSVTFAVLPALPANAEDAAAALIARGCTAQVELLAASLSPKG